MRRHSDVVQNTKGEAVEGASVSVYEAGTTTLATIYSDEGITEKDNPILTDSAGRFFFYAPDKLYDIAVSGTGVIAWTQEDVPVHDYFDASVEAGAELKVASIDVTGNIEADGNIGTTTGVVTGQSVIGQSGEFEAIGVTSTSVCPIRYVGASIAAPTITSGSGSPEGVVTAPIGSLYLRTNGIAGNTLYVKEPGTDNTGWAPV